MFQRCPKPALTWPQKSLQAMRQTGVKIRATKSPQKLVNVRVNFIAVLNTVSCAAATAGASNKQRLIE